MLMINNSQQQCSFNHLLYSIITILLLFFITSTQSLALSNNNNVQFQLSNSNLKLHKVYLRQSQSQSKPPSPWCYALTVDPTQESTIDIKYNFLASQVWPSARVAASTCEKHVKKKWKVCEFGCGPALPSLTLANLGIHVVATDIDELALQMASKAAFDQNIDKYFTTRKLDLVSEDDIDVLDDINADLYILSDVFESDDVGIGAAKLTIKALESGANVWVFAQSDRAQRESYRLELERCGVGKLYGDLEWKPFSDRYIPNGEGGEGEVSHRLLLCDLDEVRVDYG